MSNRSLYIVWGVTGGLGEGVSLALANAGHDVIGYVRDVNKVNSSILAAEHIEIRSMVISESFYRQECAYLQGRGLTIAGIVDCVGSTQTPSDATLTERFKDIMTPNLFHPYASTLIFAPVMAENASIVLVSSIRALTGTDNQNIEYAFAKAAVENLARSLVHHLKATKVRCNVVRPTPILGTQMSRAWSPQIIEELESKALYGTLLRVDDIVPVVVFLLSPSSLAINGTVIDTSGSFGL